MHLSDRRGDSRICQPSQESGWCAVAGCRAQSLDQQHFDEPREHELAAAAGIGLLGAFEATPVTTVREVFETNIFGVMAMTQAVIPQFRARRSGLIVNVTSSATLAPMPLVAVYTASKTAITGFTESLAHELADFGVGVKLVEPGCRPSTRFTENGGARMTGLIPEP